MFRQLNDTVSYWNELDRYCVFYGGDEILLSATNDADAIKEGAAVITEINTSYHGLQK